MLLALRLNLRSSKEEIFLAYLNALPFPYQTQGLQAGCELLFARSCDQLRPSEQLFVLATTQLGSNPFRDQDFQITKNRSGVLCSYLREAGKLDFIDCDTL